MNNNIVIAKKLLSIAKFLLIARSPMSMEEADKGMSLLLSIFKETFVLIKKFLKDNRRKMNRESYTSIVNVANDFMNRKINLDDISAVEAMQRDISKVLLKLINMSPTDKRIYDGMQSDEIVDHILKHG